MLNRMGAHLGFNRHSNVLRHRLEKLKIQPESCAFKLIAYGPAAREAATRDEYMLNRDHVAAMECALAKAMTEAGYRMIDSVICLDT
jgi:hypothetical protein